jgi:hypothetical protein
MRGTIGQLQERLAAAGVGYRPVIFVCHRCHGLALCSWLAVGSSCLRAAPALLQCVPRHAPPA